MTLSDVIFACIDTTFTLHPAYLFKVSQVFIEGRTGHILRGGAWPGPRTLFLTLLLQIVGVRDRVLAIRVGGAGQHFCRVDNGAIIGGRSKVRVLSRFHCIWSCEHPAAAEDVSERESFSVRAARPRVCRAAGSSRMEKQRANFRSCACAGVSDGTARDRAARAAPVSSFELRPVLWGVAASMKGKTLLSVCSKVS